ncbi:FAD-dependent oxidoreductase [Croceicoccus sp. F390]|uniref:FAD-dependent oxidoreductase n=1 Tax=Croceicoccus esteveae TaxID=3075597 RepID=A0ABU2ZEE3_9SPHN|nr:FAD-dependent oxidoreductase [Croceicoccus sp. F390]MDT0574974.1 FAD-dependent oxidoreductase [Croceicoccus sp. F390]
MNFDRSVDVLIVGSGAGGLVAALRAAEGGADVLVIEKGSLWGGTSATSGGGIWIPGSSLAAAAGQPDDLDDAFGYIRALTSDNVPDSQIRAYVDNAHVMLDWVERVAHTGYQALPYPDYYPETAGAREGFRTHLIGDSMHASDMEDASFATMQSASPAASLWGRINWKLDETYLALFRPKGWMKQMGKVMLGYWLDFPHRLKSPRDRRLTLGTKLLGSLRKALDKHKVPVWLETPLVSLIDHGGEVAGAVVMHEGREMRIGATKGVILAAGGFERNPDLRRDNLHGSLDLAHASGSQENNTGDALVAARELGAATRNLDAAWWAPTFRIPGEDRSRLSTTERALPYSIVVDQSGRRYVNEALAYHRFGEVMLESVRNPDLPKRDPSWFVFDSRYRDRYPAGPIIPGMPDALLTGTIKQVLLKADSTRELAEMMQVPVDVFEATVDRFNTMAEAGKDDDFGRGNAAYDRLYGDPRVTPNATLGSVAEGPFYAIPLHLGDIGTSGGLVTDDRGRVMRDDGSRIGGLYAIGNLAASVMGYSYPGAGSTLGPAMTFGYLAAGDAVGINS